LDPSESERPQRRRRGVIGGEPAPACKSDMRPLAAAIPRRSSGSQMERVGSKLPGPQREQVSRGVKLSRCMRREVRTTPRLGPAACGVKFGRTCVSAPQPAGPAGRAVAATGACRGTKLAAATSALTLRRVTQAPALQRGRRSVQSPVASVPSLIETHQPFRFRRWLALELFRDPAGAGGDTGVETGVDDGPPPNGARYRATPSEVRSRRCNSRRGKP
jgi:hypothetical protein